MEEKWFYPFTEEQKKKYKELVPVELWDNIFTQRMFYIDPETFEKLAKKKVKEVI
jgi:hypothetical protein